MKRDEYNVEKIVNEGENLDFEYGNTQGEESTSYLDNDDRLKDEINDNPVNNETKRPKKEKKKRKQRSSKKETNQSPEGSISSATATVATVAGAALISVTTLSALVGINLFFNAKCKMNKVEPTINSIAYELDLTDIKDDQCIITLENQDYSESQDLIEGINTGEFIDLVSSTEYHISVIDISYNNYVLFEDDVITKDEYIPAINTYTVTFVTDGGSEIPSQVVNHGDTVVKPDDPTKDNYSFMGWFTDSNLTSEYDFSAPILSDLYLYAKWEELPKVTISFEANGGTGEMETDYQYLGKEYILPECTFTAPTNYVFDCWQLASNATNYNPGDSYLIEAVASITFIAVWAEAATVELYPGIGATGSVTSLKVAIGKEYEIPSGEEYFIPPINQEFDYWFDDMYSVQRHAGDIITIEDTYYSFTGHWKDLPSIEVSFNANGGTGSMPASSAYNNTFTLPDSDFVPSSMGEKFIGWKINNDGETLEVGIDIDVNEELTLYAQWGPATLETYNAEDFSSFRNTTAVEDVAEDQTIGIMTIEIGPNACYNQYQSALNPSSSYIANTLPFDGYISSLEIEVVNSSGLSLQVEFGQSPMLSRVDYVEERKLTFDGNTAIANADSPRYSYFNITSHSSGGASIIRITVNYYV